MPGPWHWKHFPTSVSFPGASGNPGGLGFCCANAFEDTKRMTIKEMLPVTIFKGLSLLFSVGTDARLLHHLRHLRHLALDFGAELLRRARRYLEAERGELVFHLGNGQNPGHIRIDFRNDRLRRPRRREEAG